MTRPECDLVISATEINNHHGVGILLQRFFPDSTRLITLRSLTVYHGEESFGRGHHELKSATLTIPETESRLKEILAGHQIKRILCVPYFREDFIHGLLAQKLTGAPLCTYVMDDQNVFSDKVPDYWVDALLRASALRFGISPELCAAYQHKYGYPFHLLPPVVERAEFLIPCYWEPEPGAVRKVAMIGNVWTADRLRQLRALLRATNLQVDWYGNGPAASWLPGDPAEWEADHIRCLGYLPEDDLVAALASYPCVLVPSGSLDQDDDNLSFSRLSLPSRLIFLHTRTDTPVLLLGSDDSAAGRFLRNLGTGLCAGYHADELERQLTRMLDPAVRGQLRGAIRRWAPHFILSNGGKWLWDSLDRRAPIPAEFHAAFGRNADDGQWLRTIPRAKGKPDYPVPPPDASLTDETMKAFAFLRTSHLPLLALHRKAQRRSEASDLELGQLLREMTEYLLIRQLPRGGHVLVLGNVEPEWARRLSPQLTGWRIKDPETWRAAGFSPSTSEIVLLDGRAATVPPEKFDAIVSVGWTDQVKTPAEASRLMDFLTQHTREGGINLHTFNAVINPDYFWVSPLHPQLIRSWPIAGWPGLDDILTAPDLFVMEQETYETHWRPTSDIPYESFGKPIGLVLFWRRPTSAAGQPERLP